MAYGVGSIIYASDINSWLSTVNAVWSTGSGDRGYGQTSTQGAVSTGTTITSAQWMALRYMLQTAAAHQGTATSLLPGTDVLDPSDIVYAHVNGTNPNNFSWASMVGNVDANRLTTSGADMTLATAAGTSAARSFWTASSDITATVTFSSEDHARYFFNTGGEIRIRLAPQPSSNISFTNDHDWNTTMSSRVGTVTLKAHSTSRTGSSGTVLSNVGYYELTGSTQTIYSGINIGGGAYSQNDVQIGAITQNRTLANGGNGTAIQFGISLRDDYVGGSDFIQSGITAYVDLYRVNTTYLPAAVAAPTVTFGSWSGT